MIKYLEKLLNGREVEWKKLGDVCEIKRGRVLSKKYLEDNKGQYPVYSSQTLNNGEIGKINSYDYDGEYLTWTTDGAYAGTVFYRNEKFSITNICGLIDVKDKRTLNIKFLFYCLQISTKNYVTDGSGNPKLMSNVVEKIDIPIPPLDIQEEIVRVLDKLTELTKELTKELTLRKKEYNYYRDYLLKFENKVEIVKLGNVVKVYDGTHQTPDYKTEGIPFISVENIANIYNTEKYISEDDYEKNYKITPQIDDVFMTRIGTVGKCAVVTQNSPLAYYVSLALLRPDKNKINSRYLKHIIESQVGKKELNKRILHTAIPIKINKGDIDKLEFPLPSLEIQERIVNVLDNFEKICNDLNIGLPKEIELRQKEYEYYREYILTNIGNRITLEDKTI